MLTLIFYDEKILLKCLTLIALRKYSRARISLSLSLSLYPSLSTRISLFILSHMVWIEFCCFSRDHITHLASPPPLLKAHVVWVISQFVIRFNRVIFLMYARVCRAAIFWNHLDVCVTFFPSEKVHWELWMSLERKLVLNLLMKVGVCGKASHHWCKTSERTSVNSNVLHKCDAVVSGLLYHCIILYSSMYFLLELQKA